MLKLFSNRDLFISAILLAGIILGANSGFVLADASNSEVVIENPLGNATLTDIINNLIDFLLTIALIICPLMIVIGGFYYVTSGGDPEKAKRGRQIITYAAIGLVIVLISKGLVAAVKTAIGVD